MGGGYPCTHQGPTGSYRCYNLSLAAMQLVAVEPPKHETLELCSCLLTHLLACLDSQIQLSGHMLGKRFSEDPFRDLAISPFGCSRRERSTSRVIPEASQVKLQPYVQRRWTTVPWSAASSRSTLVPILLVPQRFVSQNVYIYIRCTFKKMQR